MPIFLYLKHTIYKIFVRYCISFFIYTSYIFLRWFLNVFILFIRHNITGITKLSIRINLFLWIWLFLLISWFNRMKWIIISKKTNLIAFRIVCNILTIKNIFLIVILKNSFTVVFNTSNINDSSSALLALNYTMIILLFKLHLNFAGIIKSMLEIILAILKFYPL